MATEKINMAQFDIDVDQLIRAAQDVKQRIDEIKKEQKELTEAGKSSSEAFINNAVSLRELNKEYNTQLKVLGQVNAATGKTIPLQQQLDEVMNREVKTINDLRKQNSDLLKTRNNVNIETAEGQKQLELINAALDENNEKIKANVSGYEQQKMSIGGYADGIKEALGGTSLFGGALNDVNEVLERGKPLVTGLKNEWKGAYDSIRSAAEGTEDLTVAQKAWTVAGNISIGTLKLLKAALISTGIGAIVVLVGSLIAYLSRSEKAMQSLSKAFSAFGGIVNQLMRYLEPLGKLIADGITKSIEFLGKVANQVMKDLAGLLDFLGFEDAAAGLRNFNKEMNESVKLSRELAEAENNLQQSQRKARLTQLEYQRDAERLRQIRDDENLTIRERIKANEELGAVLDKQLNEELKIAQQALEVANLRLKQEGETTANLDAQAEALTEIADIEERITGQRSEQLTNQVSLQREAQQLAEEAAQKRIDQMNAELDLFVEQQGFRAKSLEEELALERQYAEKRKAILQTELDAKKISQTEYNTEILRLNNDLARKQAEITVENARRELDALAQRVERARSEETFMTELRLEALEEQQHELAAARARFERERFEQGLITEQEFQDARNQIIIEKEDALKELRDERRQAAAEERALQMELELEALEQQGASIFEIESLQIEQQRERDLEAAREKYRGTAMLANAELLANQKADRAQAQLAFEKDNAILQSRASLFGAIAKIVGEETFLGKTAALATATINTYQGATKALASLPPPASFIAAGATIASGLAQVANIAGVNPEAPAQIEGFGQIAANAALIATPIPLEPGFADGGLINRGTPIKRANGDDVLITAKKGEAILNERQQAFLGRDMLRMAGVPGFASGGIVGAPATTATVQNIITNQINAGLTDAISDAVQAGAEAGTYAGSRNGIVDLSSERQIAVEANF